MSGSTRRGFLQGVTGLATAGLAGCAGRARTGGPADGPTAQSSFFVVADFTANVARDAMTVETLVPFGQHGHGWEPGPTIQRDVLDADAFVYVGEGFQPWADEIVQNVRDDDAPVHVIEAGAAVDLLSTREDEHVDEAQEESHAEDEHDHARSDPHFWLDPLRAIQSVETIAEGLRVVLPEEDATIRSNASTYVARLEQLDEDVATRLSGRSRDTVLFAGHNSFRYLGHRYGFTVESLSDLAPDDTPSPRDVADAQALVGERDIEYVLAPVFESDQAARQLVEQTDAVGVLPLTPVPTLTTEWAAEGWDFVDVVTNVNLESLATALGAE